MESKRVLIGQAMTPGSAVPPSRGHQIRDQMGVIRTEAQTDRDIAETVVRLRRRYRRKTAGWFWLMVSAGLFAYLWPHAWPAMVPPGLGWLWNLLLWGASLADDFEDQIRKRLGL